MSIKAIAIVICLICTTGVFAKKGGKHGGHAGFAAPDVVVIQEFYRSRPLPPGIEKHLIKKGSLPPGIAKKIAPFPMELERRLPPLPPGVYRGQVGGVAVIYDPVTRIILDVADIAIAIRQM